MFDYTQPQRGRKAKTFSETEMFNNMLNVWVKLGRQPKSTDMTKDNGSRINAATYAKHFDGFQNALKAFCNSDVARNYKKS